MIKSDLIGGSIDRSRPVYLLYMQERKTCKKMYPMNETRNFPIIFRHHVILILAFDITSFIAAVFPSSPVTVKDKPVITFPARRRWKAISLRILSCDETSADPPVPELNPRHRCRPPTVGADQQKNLHHQARDTLHGDEGDEMTPTVSGSASRTPGIDSS